MTYVLDFLVTLYDNGVGYSAINTARSALSAAVSLSDSAVPVGEHPLVRRFMKGIYESRPTFRKYTKIWDVKTVLNYVATIQPVDTVSLQLLTHKLTFLLALLSGQRCQSLHVIKLSDIHWEENVVKISLSEKIKQSGPRRQPPIITLPAYDKKPLCVVHTLQAYLSRTQSLRSTSTENLLLATVKPYGPVSKSTIARWIRTVLAKAGIDVSVYGAHSTRAASTSTAAKQIPIATVLRAAGWSSAATFHRFYNLPVETVDNTSVNFATSILDHANVDPS